MDTDIDKGIDTDIDKAPAVKTAVTKIQSVSTLTIDQLADICESEGVTVQSVCKALAEGLQSNTIGKVDDNGDLVKATVQADMAVRHKYMVSAMEVLRLVKKDVMDINVTHQEHKYSSEDLGRMEVIAKELTRLEEIRRSDPVQRGEVIDVATVI